MKISVKFSNTECELELFTAQFSEDRKIIPDYFFKKENLKRPILDIKLFEEK